jgi:hypothetical protein
MSPPLKIQASPENAIQFLDFLKIQIKLSFFSFTPIAENFSPIDINACENEDIKSKKFKRILFIETNVCSTNFVRYLKSVKI